MTNPTASPPPSDSPSDPGNRPKSRKKQRLDLLLVERGLVESREQARRLIMAGEVFVNDTIYDKPGQSVPDSVAVRVRSPLPYVSRGGLKLAAALDEFQLDVRGKIAMDVGASTGGFTDCLLQRGAAQVYAIDVGYGQLAWKLRSDPRVIVMERTNIRYLTALPDGVQAELAVIDASFISLTLVLPPTLQLMHKEADLVILIKPQFEAGKEQVGKGGVVRDPAVHRHVLETILHFAQQQGLAITGLHPSPLLGPAGNIEFLLWCRRSPISVLDSTQAITQAIQNATQLKKSA